MHQAERDEGQEAKRKLEALFGGAPVASSSSDTERRPSPRHKVYASPRRSTGRAPSEFHMRKERLRMAREPEEIRAAADLFLKHHQLPDEIDILYKVMQHPDEKVVRDAMGQISSLLMQGRLETTVLLVDRLDDLEKRCSEEATRSYIDGLRRQIERKSKH